MVSFRIFVKRALAEPSTEMSVALKKKASRAAPAFPAIVSQRKAPHTTAASARPRMLKAKKEELVTRNWEQNKLKIELKKLQKIKEFKPTVTFPRWLGLKDQEQEKKEKKKGGKKKPSPPYMLWCKDQWNEVKKVNPDADFKDMSNLLGAKWKSISAEEKKPYEERYQAEKEAYLKIVGNNKRECEAMKLLEYVQKYRTAIELLEQYLQFKQEAEKENTKKTKKEKEPWTPKQPMSAYLIFSNERIAALLAENKNILEAAKITGKEWKNMTEKERAPYEQIALKNKERYVQEMEVCKFMRGWNTPMTMTQHLKSGNNE